MTHTQITDLIASAKSKAAQLTNMQMIRVSPEFNYWVLDMNGSKYIGYMLREPATKIYKNKAVFDFCDKNNEVIGQFQVLKMY